MIKNKFSSNLQATCLLFYFCSPLHLLQNTSPYHFKVTKILLNANLGYYLMCLQTVQCMWIWSSIPWTLKDHMVHQTLLLLLQYPGYRWQYLPRTHFQYRQWLSINLLLHHPTNLHGKVRQRNKKIHTKEKHLTTHSNKTKFF